MSITYFVQPVVRLQSVDALQSFVASATCNPAIGYAVTDLKVSFNRRQAYSSSLLRKCLMLVPNTTDLILTLPPSGSASIFSDVHLARLVMMKTNLSHRVIEGFLQRHPNVRCVVLGACGRRRHCPLGHLTLNYVNDLESSLECAKGLAGPNLRRLNVSMLSRFPVTTLLRTIYLQGLSHLSVEIRADDHDILQVIASVAPALRNLRLMINPPSKVRLSWHFY